MARTVLIILDGLNFQTAALHMGYMRSLAARHVATLRLIKCCKPSLSRPIYATLLCGQPPHAHGIITNECARQLEMPTIFSVASAAGLVTAAAAYYWIYELCHAARFDPRYHRFVAEPGNAIGYGLFYSHDEYPDGELFADAEALCRLAEPDFLLCHSMAIDFSGHAHGAGSSEYMAACKKADQLLEQYLPLWLHRGYRAIITSDHGMSRDGSHLADEPSVRNVPLWFAGFDSELPEDIGQTDIAPLMADWLGLDWPLLERV